MNEVYCNLEMWLRMQWYCSTIQFFLKRLQYQLRFYFNISFILISFKSSNSKPISTIIKFPKVISSLNRHKKKMANTFYHETFYLLHSFSLRTFWSANHVAKKCYLQVETKRLQEIWNFYWKVSAFVVQG